MSKTIDLTGLKFGKWTVMEKDSAASNGTLMWLCKCECGTIKKVRGTTLRNGESVSCGCSWRFNIECERIHYVWEHMKQRCYNPKNTRYKHYGGRGITICQEWLDDFMNFYNWSIDNGYKEDLTIDRINVNGNYEPSNCRWITNKEQQSNKQYNHLITFNDKTKAITQWAECLGIRSNTLFTRIDKYGWSIEKALTTPVEKRK